MQPSSRQEPRAAAACAAFDVTCGRGRGGFWPDRGDEWYAGQTLKISGVAQDDEDGGTPDLAGWQFEAILRHVPVREADPEAPLQLQICSLDYATYVGRIGIGRIKAGRIKSGQPVVVMNGPDATPVNAKVNQVQVFKGLERTIVESAPIGIFVDDAEGMTSYVNPALADVLGLRADLGAGQLVKHHQRTKVEGLEFLELFVVGDVKRRPPGDRKSVV